MPRYDFDKFELKIEPHSAFYSQVQNDVEPIHMLVDMDPYTLAHALFSISEFMGEGLSVKVHGKTHLTNFAFIIFNEVNIDETLDQIYSDEIHDEILTKTVSKKNIIDVLKNNKFSSSYDSIYTHKKTFVDCLLNRNKNMDEFYHLIRNSIPLFSAKKNGKSHLNVISTTSIKHYKVLTTRKSIFSIGLMNRFIFLNNKLNIHNEKINEVINSFMILAKENNKYEQKFSYRLSYIELDEVQKLEQTTLFEIKKIITVREHVQSLHNLYLTLLIKIYAVVCFLRSSSSRRVVNSALCIANSLSRKLINEKILLMSKNSKETALYFDLKEFIKQHGAVRHRDIIRKFQSYDKNTLKLFIDHFLERKFIRTQILNKYENKKLPKTYFFNK